MAAKARPRLQRAPAFAVRRRATLSARRTRSGAMVGFHARREARIVEIPECRVLDPAIPAGFEALRTVATLGGSRKDGSGGYARHSWHQVMVRRGEEG